MLQPGTGSTDAVIGGYYSAPGMGEDASWFAQVLYQQPVSTKDEYKPGSQLQLNIGYRLPFAGDWQALLQLNGMLKGKDSDANSEPDLSGSRTLFLSPGLAYSITHDFQLYSFVQLSALSLLQRRPARGRLGGRRGSDAEVLRGVMR